MFITNEIHVYIYNTCAIPKQLTGLRNFRSPTIIRYVIRRHFTTVPLLPLRNTTVSDNYSVRLTQ